MSKIVIVGDPHVGKSPTLGRAGIGSTLNSRIVDQLHLLDHVLERAIHIGAERIVLTGDIFEEPKPPINLITLFIAWLKHCQLYNIAIHIIVGNHDVLRSGSIYTSTLDIISGADLNGVFVHHHILVVHLNII